MNKETDFLRKIKAILISIGVIKLDCVLHADSWLQYLKQGYTPVRAVREDFDGYTIPFINWMNVEEILDTI